ncbi:COPII coat assembly protein, Sec [Parasponia andersonii]|uniref:Protein transport protein sec16 n=1 Tax=Parasponia andersonii TaxID=3476 RepID=A0A2P5CJD5_PARAD|nr:COPII coat assembly protein, Sec [Parasponia andersonii]
MASSPPFEVEDDQTDEDFFDKLVNDEVDYTGSVPSVAENIVSDEANALSNLAISEPDSAKVDSGGDVGFGIHGDLGEKDESTSESMDAHVGSLDAKEAVSPILENSNESSEVGLDGREGKSSESEAGNVKEVQWDSFNSDSHLHRGSGYRSYSDLFTAMEGNSEDPFANVVVEDKSVAQSCVADVAMESSVADLGSSSVKHGEEQYYGTAQEQNVNGQDLSSSQYWENLYPGWKYDPNTGQWYQLEGYSVSANASVIANYSANLQESSNLASRSAQSESNVSEWNQVSQGKTEYPAHMVFDPQYPGWYYDSLSQEWKVLDSCTPAVDYSKGVDSKQQYLTKTQENYGTQNWDVSMSSYNQQNASMWQTQQSAQSVTFGYARSQQLGNQYALKDHRSDSVNQHQTKFNLSGSVSYYESTNPSGNFAQLHNQTNEGKPQGMNFSFSQFDSQSSILVSQQPLESENSFSQAVSEERTSEGRPPHALVTFGFGGKLIVMKDATSFHANSTHGIQDSRGGLINVLNMTEVFMDKTHTSMYETGGGDYFPALCQQHLPGPLVNGNVGSKELKKWIDDKIANYETPYIDYWKGDLLRLLFSLLKLALQYYGKLRSPFGSDQALKEIDSPELAVAKLFASSKRNHEYGTFVHCLQNIPSEAQIQATALEVQKLLVSGRKKEALECAQEGQLWGPALVLAMQLGEQFYGDTVKKMALKQFIAGSPLRSLCLLFAGQQADVFSNAATESSLHNSANMFQQQVKANCTLDQWTENLAIITANRTKDDELVVIHLGDCLWTEMGEITAAHICYLIAEANFEPYSDGARLCLIGADHWRFPRTYASPEAIQRTELYEYSKVLENSQFLLLPFQPYKLIYAHMLAEVGKISDALKYCQALSKSLKTGRAPEVDTWKQLVLSLEDQIKVHQQSGYGSNLARKFRTFFGGTAIRVAGGLPPPVHSTAQANAQPNEHANQLGGPRVSNSQSTMAMPSLMPSASMEPISQWTGESDHKTMTNRSISEPDFSRSPENVDSSKKTSLSNTEEKPSASSGSRFSRFGSRLFQNTIGLVIRSRPDKQAKLGKPNSFYYDDKLKRWVEEGAEPPLEQEALPPPPTTAAFQSGTQDYGLKDSPKPERFDTVAGTEIRSPNSSEKSPGIPIPPGSNQFSLHGRMGVRSRYVDTFNKSSGTTANLFHSPSTPAAKPAAGTNPKFFIPAPVISSEKMTQTIGESLQETAMINNNSSTSLKEGTYASTQMPTSTMPMQRFPSVDNIVSKPREVAKGNNSPLPPHARRTASWSAGLADARSPSVVKDVRPLGEGLGISPPMYMPSVPSPQSAKKRS